MIAVSKDYSLIISGNGDVIEADDDVMAIGSGGLMLKRRPALWFVILI